MDDITACAERRASAITSLDDTRVFRLFGTLDGIINYTSNTGAHMAANTPVEIDRELGKLERQWFTVHRAELSARNDLETATRNNEARIAQAAEQRVKEAQERKRTIIRDIERLEDELIDAD